MERFEIELISVADDKKRHLAVRQALCNGFFMQVAHKEGEKGNYLTVKDNQVMYFSGNGHLRPVANGIPRVYTGRWATPFMRA